MITLVFSRPRNRTLGSAILQVPAVGLAFLLCFLTARPADAQFRDVGYTLEPTVQGVFEDDAAAIESSPLYGGALGLSFGRYFQASAEYLVNTGATADFSNIERLEGLIDRDVDVRRYGARLRFNLYDRRVIPYLTAGSGVMQFDPEQTGRTRTIYGTYGAGITFSAYDRYRISIAGEILNYRYDPVATFLGPAGTGDFETGTVTVTSPSLSASLSLFLGGRSLEEQTAVDQALQDQFGGGGLLRGVRLSVNPFHGRIEFNDALGFPKDQNVAGVNAGISLGPFVGLQGFYWRGTQGATVTEDVVGGFDDIQMYGGELNLRLNFELGRGFVPYAKVGGGYLDVLSGYDQDIPADASPPEDRFFGITGAGLEVPLTRSIKLSGGVRGLIMDNPNVEEAGDSGDLYGSLMYTGGLEFRLGGEPDRTVSGPEPTPVLVSEDTTAPEPEAVSEEEPEAQTETEQLRARADSLEAALAELQAARQAPARPTQRPPVRADTTVVPSTPAARRSNLSDRTMVVPVPESGEIYVRFGEDEAPTDQASPPVAESRPSEAAPEDIEQQVRKALRQQLRQQGRADTAQALTDANIERMVQRAVRNAVRERETTTAQREQSDQAGRIQRLQNQVDDLQRQLREERSEPQKASRPDETVTTASAPDDTTPFYRSSLGRPLTYLVPITGFRAGKGEEQFQIGVRGDYRSTPSSRLHFVPELSFGVGGGSVSPTILFSAAYSFLRGTTTDLVGLPLEPYVGLGGGIASLGGFTFEPVITSTIGFDYRFQGGRRVFIEYSAFDRFSTSRVHVGIRVGL